MSQTLSIRIPSYRLHKSSGQAVVRLSGRDVYLGRHETPESRERYEQVVRQWLANNRRPPRRSGRRRRSSRRR